MFRNADRWFEAYKKKDALWVHDDNPLRPHALLTSGLHSNGFFNSRLVTEDPQLLDEAAYDLMELFVEQGGNSLQVQGCVGPQTGATKLAEAASAWFKIKNSRPCFWASPAKHGEGDNKSMVFSDSERAMLKGNRSVPLEDVVTTGLSVRLMDAAVESAGGIMLPYLLALVNRSGQQVINGKRVVALIKRDMLNEEPDACKLCKMGSKAIRPKEGDNWALLNAQY